MLMIDFPFLLLFLIVASGAIWLADHLLFAKQRIGGMAQNKATLPILVDYSKSLFWVFVVVFLLRSFVAQLFVVPTASLAPTIVPVEFMFVTQFSYGLRMPIWNKTLLNTWDPQVGDIAVFHWPTNPQVDFIKRVIGVPGDTISYINKVFYINGKAMPQKYIRTTMYGDPGMTKWTVKEMQEDLMGVKHNIYICPETSLACPGRLPQNFYNLVIPKGEYLMVGDNRDDSDDGRFWGLVPTKDLVGKAQFIAFSWNASASLWNKINWRRIGTRV